jgi:8-oxo-dGTP diphosphatase
MQTIKRRRRGTAIVETPIGILVVAGRRKLYILPGGGANIGESRTKAAVRELKEETGITAKNIKHIISIHASAFQLLRCT